MTYHSYNNILETLKFCVGDLRLTPLIKISHVVHSKFYSGRKEYFFVEGGGGGVGAWIRSIWLRIGTHGVWPAVSIMIRDYIFRCL